MTEKPKGIYVPIDVLITDDEDIADVGMIGFAVYVSGLCYAKRRKTDGIIPLSIVPRLLVSPSLEDLDGLSDVVADLCRVGLWNKEDEGYRIRNWSEWNPTTEDRERWAGRKAKSRAGHADVTPSHGDVTQESRVEEKRREVRTRAATPRKRNVLVDTLAEIEHSDPTQLTRSHARSLGVAVAEIEKATPDVSPDDIRSRAAVYSRKHPTWELTGPALAKHWAGCASNGKPSGGVWDREPPE